MDGSLSDTQQMMYAFGDTRRPNSDTAKLLETVVLNQISDIVQTASNVTITRNAKVLSLEDIVFLMRNSPVKLQRLVKYLAAKDISTNTKAMVDGEFDVTTAAGGNKDEAKSTRRCKDFIQKIDEGGKLIAACNEEYFDEIQVERLIRNDRVTRTMDEKRYEEFCKARAVGFRGQYSSKFQKNLQEVYSTLEAETSVTKIEKIVKDVISYLAYETLGQLVEMCLLVRRDSVTDPLERMMEPNSVNLSYPSINLPVPVAATKRTSSPTPEQIEATKKSEQTVSNACQPISPAEVREVLRRLQYRHSSVRPLARGSWSKPTNNMPILAIL